MRDASVDAGRIDVDWESMSCTVHGSYCNWDAPRIGGCDTHPVTAMTCTVRVSYSNWMRHASVDAARIQRSFNTEI
jgi:hypothetical protein